MIVNNSFFFKKPSKSNHVTGTHILIFKLKSKIVKEKSNFIGAYPSLNQMKHVFVTQCLVGFYAAVNTD